MGITGRGIGMYRMMAQVKKAFPRIQYGYFNRTKENFFPEGFETGWPIKEKHECMKNRKKEAVVHEKHEIH